jgi:hypothetical protein
VQDSKFPRIAAQCKGVQPKEALTMEMNNKLVGENALLIGEIVIICMKIGRVLK